MKAKRRLTVGGMVTGALLMLSPVFALLGRAADMLHRSSTFSGEGVAHPRAVAESIALTIVTMVAGVILLAVGIIIFTVSLIIYLRLRQSTPPPLPPTPGE